MSLQEQTADLDLRLPTSRIQHELSAEVLLLPGWKHPRSRAVHAAFLAHDPAAATEEASSTVEAEASEVLKQAKVAKHVADRAVRFAWAAVFICGVGATIDLVGASVDYRSTMRSKEELDEEEAELEATGWPRWLHQMDS